MPENQTLGRGELHFAPFLPGSQTPGGYRYFGNTPSFNLSVSSENLAHYSSDRGIKTKTKSVTLQTDFAGNFTCDNINLDNVGLFFLGSTSKVTQSSASAQSYTITKPKRGLSYQIGVSDTAPLGARNVTISTITVPDGASTDALVAGTDYVLDSARGLITFLEAGTLVTGEIDVSISSYSVAAISYDRAISGTSQIKGALMFLAFNAEGENFDYHMFNVSISPNGDMPLKGDEWLTMPFNVEIGRAAGREAIYANGQPYVSA